MRHGISKSVAPFERPLFKATSGFSVLTGVPSLVGWWQAAQKLYSATSGGTLVTTDATNIARWEDLSGNGNHFIQGTTANQMQLKTGIINGKSVVRSPGAPANMTVTTPSPATLTVGTLFMVYWKRGTRQAFGRLFESGANDGIAIVSDGSDQFLWYQMGSNSTASESTSGEANVLISPHILVNRSGGNGVSNYGYYDGNRDGNLQNATNCVTVLPLWLGCYGGAPTGPYNMQADFAEIIYSNAVLSFTVINQVLAYLSSLYAITVGTAS